MSTSKTVRFLLKVGILLVIIVAAYYLGVVKPRSRLPNALLQAEKVLTGRRSNLVQNRLAFIDLAKLDPAQVNFGRARSDLLDILKQTNGEGRTLLAGNISQPMLAGAPSAVLSFLNTELPASLADLADQHRMVLEGQGALIETLSSFDEIVGNIYQYNADADIKKLNPSSEAGEIEKRVRVADEAMRNIRVSLKRFDSPMMNTLSLQQALGETNQAILNLLRAARVGDPDTIAEAVTVYVGRLNDLRRSAFEIERDVLRGPAVVTALTKQTNLIANYDFWLTKVDFYQATIGR